MANHEPSLAIQRKMFDESLVSARNSSKLQARRPNLIADSAKLANPRSLLMGSKIGRLFSGADGRKRGQSRQGMLNTVELSLLGGHIRICLGKFLAKTLPHLQPDLFPTDLNLHTLHLNLDHG